LEKISVTIASRLADDRNTMAAILAEQGDFLISGIAGDNFEVVRSAILLQPNVIIMDFYLEEHNTLKIVPIIKRNSPATTLIVLCSAEEHIAVNHVLRAGISGYLLKQDLACLALAVKCVFCGGLYVSEKVKKQVFNYFSAGGITMHCIEKVSSCDTVVRHRVFTPTELQIFQGIILGRSDSKIAENLNISTGAVRNCIYHAKKKIGLQNRTQVSIYALSSGLIAWENDFLEAKKA